MYFSKLKRDSDSEARDRRKQTRGGILQTCCRASWSARTDRVILCASWLVLAVSLRALKALPSAPSLTRICAPPVVVGTQNHLTRVFSQDQRECIVLESRTSAISFARPLHVCLHELCRLHNRVLAMVMSSCEQNPPRAGHATETSCM